MHVISTEQKNRRIPERKGEFNNQNDLNLIVIDYHRVWFFLTNELDRIMLLFEINDHCRIIEFSVCSRGFAKWRF